MPRFTVKEMLIATAFIAAGLSCLYLVFTADWLTGLFGKALLWFGGGGMIGMGLLPPFKRPVLDFVLGVSVQTAIIVIVAWGRYYLMDPAFD